MPAKRTLKLSARGRMSAAQGAANDKRGNEALAAFVARMRVPSQTGSSSRAEVIDLMSSDEEPEAGPSRPRRDVEATAEEGDGQWSEGDYLEKGGMNDEGVAVGASMAMEVEVEERPVLTGGEEENKEDGEGAGQKGKTLWYHTGDVEMLQQQTTDDIVQDDCQHDELVEEDGTLAADASFEADFEVDMSRVRHLVDDCSSEAGFLRLLRPAFRDVISEEDFDAWWQSIRQHKPSHAELNDTRLRCEARRLELKRLAAEGGIPDHGFAMPVGAETSRLVFRWCWSPAAPGMEASDSILTRAKKTPRRGLEKGLRKDMFAPYVYNATEARIERPGGAPLPRFLSTPASTTQTLYRGRTVPADLTPSIASVIASLDHDRSILRNFSIPRLILSMGAYSQNARDYILRDLPLEVVRLQREVSISIPPLACLHQAAFEHTVEVIAILHEGRLRHLHLNQAHASISDYPSPRTHYRYGDGVWQDITFNWMVRLSGLHVPGDALIHFAKASFPGVDGDVSSHPAFCRGVKGFRAAQVLESVRRSDLTKGMDEFVVANGLQAVPDNDPDDERPYCSRVLCAYQKMLHGRKLPGEIELAHKRRNATIDNIPGLRQAISLRNSMTQLLKTRHDGGNRTAMTIAEAQRIEFAQEEASRSSLELARQRLLEKGNIDPERLEERAITLAGKMKYGKSRVRLAIYSDGEGTIFLDEAMLDANVPTGLSLDPPGMVVDAEVIERLRLGLREKYKNVPKPLRVILELWVCSTTNIFFLRRSVRNAQDDLFVTKKMLCPICRTPLWSTTTQCEPVQHVRNVFSCSSWDSAVRDVRTFQRRGARPATQIDLVHLLSIVDSPRPERLSDFEESAQARAVAPNKFRTQHRAKAKKSQNM